ncbi:MAG: SPFH domain-containing protein [Pirellulales bacterium]
MSQAFDSFAPRGRSLMWKYWRRRLIVLAVLVFALLALFLILWNEFFAYVPQGQHLVIVAKEGSPLPPDEVLAEPGQKGIRRQVQGEGWHFVMPILYTWELEDNLIVPPGKVGIVTSKGGKSLPPDRVLAESDDERGIRKDVLPPGTYRINLHGFDVELVDAVDIPAGFVGVLRRKLGEKSKGRFAESDAHQGIVPTVLEPGLYYLNTREYEVEKTKVGIFQTTFRYDEDPAQNTAITFTCRGGFQISMDCTVEWEILPEDMPKLVAEYGARERIEQNVVDVQAHAIGRDKGIDYGVQDFLEGSKREKFQQQFTDELTRVCKVKNVTVHSAFIRNIVIPENYLQPIRDKQIAAETELTNKAKEATAQSEADVEREQQLIQQRVAEVEAETRRLVAELDRQVENLDTGVKAEIEKVMAEYGAQIAELDAQRTQLLGEAEANVVKLRETAENTLFPLTLEAFENDADAYLRYSLADQLNPNVQLRLFHSGPGTFWTNMGQEKLNFLMPVGGATADPKAPVNEPPAAAPRPRPTAAPITPAPRPASGAGANTAPPRPARPAAPAGSSPRPAQTGSQPSGDASRASGASGS